MDRPKGDFNNDAIYVSELIKDLQEILINHGDLPVYAGLDYSWISFVNIVESNAHIGYGGKFVTLDA
ncbi:MAG TPA: hypothetical protein DDY71_11220 [Spirochaetia bacterium]|nr:hypothetical protein [Spirochaetia bacterium]